MNDTLPIEVHRQKALFSRDLPFKPQYGMMLYVEVCANEEINGYFHKNMEKACRILGESFTYLPAMLDKLAQIVEYNWPETDSAWIEKAKSDPSWIQDTYREILSYRIDKEDEMPELPLQITEPPMLMRYEETSSDGHVFTLFPLRYSNDAQFEQLLTAIAQVPRLDSNIFHSTLIEHPLRSSRLREHVVVDPKDNADRGRIDELADEIRQRIEELRSIGVSDFVIKKLITLPDPKPSTLRITYCPTTTIWKSPCRHSPRWSISSSCAIPKDCGLRSWWTTARSCCRFTVLYLTVMKRLKWNKALTIWLTPPAIPSMKSAAASAPPL